MGRLNGLEDFKSYLPEEIIHLGNDLEKDQQVPFEIEWLGKDSDILWVFGGCHCTDAYYENGKIKGTINMSRAGYDRETGVVSQHVHVYLNDGNEYYISDTKKRRVSNPLSNYVSITLSGKVKV